MREHLEGLREAMVAFVRYVERAGLRAPVPTAPAWRTRKLVAHQGLVHRWATAQLAGKPIDQARVEAEGMNHDDPLDWLREGSLQLVTALASGKVAPDALVFLVDAGDPREFWARRQCHETTIHAVDALAASLGRIPTPADAEWITREVALDGIDELLDRVRAAPRRNTADGHVRRRAPGRRRAAFGPMQPMETLPRHPAAGTCIRGSGPLLTTRPGVGSPLMRTPSA